MPPKKPSKSSLTGIEGMAVDFMRSVVNAHFKSDGKTQQRFLSNIAEISDTIIAKKAEEDTNGPHRKP